MSPRTRPPFRADHVGSLLRPQALLKAREDRARGRDFAAELRADRGRCDPRGRPACRRISACKAVTDGEFRRIDWFMDFKYAIGGIEKLTRRSRCRSAPRPAALDFEFVAYRVGERMRLDDTIFARGFRLPEIGRDESDRRS